MYSKFILIFRAIHRQNLSKCRDKSDLNKSTMGQGRIIHILKFKKEIKQKDLLFYLDISKQSLAESLSKLEKNGYIVREPSKEDKRVLIIKLTKKGEEINFSKAKENIEALNIFNDFTEDELIVLDGFIERIIKKLETEDSFDDEFIKRRIAFEKLIEDKKNNLENLK